MDVLLALVSAEEQLVTKDRLVAAAWPNVFVHEGNLKVTVASLRRALRKHDPDREYIFTVAGRGYWLRFEGEPSGPAKTIENPRTPLPDPGLVLGREFEVAEIESRLLTGRLLTVVGSGGLGKTTVALAAARSMASDGDELVTFIDLGKVGSAEYVASSLATALGVNPEGKDRLTAITTILARRSGLLVFDTCEHVLEAVTEICGRILSETTAVRILATSQHVIGIEGEDVLRLKPLAVPTVGATGRLDEVLRFSAPQLLVKLAAEYADYQPREADSEAIADICRRLDGSPLAIKLVASKLAEKGPTGVLNELDHRFRLLRQDGPLVPLRQHTLLVTFEWSYALLSRDEKMAFRSMAVFAGFFDAADVTQVISHLGRSQTEVSSLLRGLHAKSMISAVGSPDNPRYRLLDTAREFAEDLLQSHGEVEGVSANHARLQLRLLADLGKAANAAIRGGLGFADRADDLRRAIEWALHKANDVALGIDLVAAGLPLWHTLYLGEETRRNCQQALAELESIVAADGALKLRLMIGLATVSTFLESDPANTVHLMERALRQARELGDVDAEFRLLGGLSNFAVLTGGPVAQRLDEMREAAARTGSRVAAWDEEQLRAVWETIDARFKHAYRRVARLRGDIRSVAEKPGDFAQAEIKTEVHWGALNWFAGKPDQAVHAVRTAAERAVELDDPPTLIHVLLRGALWTLTECQEFELARHYTEILRTTVYDGGLAAWAPVVDCYHYAIGSLSGENPPSNGLRTTFEKLSAGSFQVGHHGYYATLANAMVAVGQWDDAAATLRYVFERYPKRWILPEFMRLRAATHAVAGHVTDAEGELRLALGMADQTGCVAWQVRSAHDLARMLVDRDEAAEALRILEPVCARFEPEAQTVDIGKVRRLIGDLKATAGDHRTAKPPAVSIGLQ